MEHDTAIMVTHQIRDAFYVATHEAVRDNGRRRIQAIPEATSPRATFMVLHDGRIRFEGSAADLRAPKDAYLREFLFLTLPPW
jgi:ABC-type nitrate/sulfonate/bicarbonate transport system ATPase subunit